MNIFNKDHIEGKDIIAICPSRERYGKLRRMVASFKETVGTKAGLVVVVDFNDPQLNDYLEFLRKEAAYTILPQGNTTTIFNRVFKEAFPKAAMYHMTNDDTIYRTKDFDEIVWEKEKEVEFGVFYGNDGIHNEKLCTFPFISGCIVQSLGWLQMPKLWFLYSDCIWHMIGEELNSLYYFPNIVIEHDHHLRTSGVVDKTAQTTNAHDVYTHDLIEYTLWSTRRSHRDIERVRRSLG